MTFDPLSEGPSLAPALAHFQYLLKGVSFLPRRRGPWPGARAAGACNGGYDPDDDPALLPASQPYPQMPYEQVTRSEFRRLEAQITKAGGPGRFLSKRGAGGSAGGSAGGGRELGDRATPDMFCESDRCEIPISPAPPLGK